MGKKEKFAGTPVTGVDVVTKARFMGDAADLADEVERVFGQIGKLHAEFKRVINAQALLIGSMAKVMVSKGYITQEELDLAMEELASSQQQVQNAANVAPTEAN